MSPRSLLVGVGALGVVVVLTRLLLAQTPATTPQLWVASAMLGDTSFKTGLLRVGKGLRVVVGADGNRSLELDLPPTRCVSDANGNISCVTGDSPSFPIPRLTSVHDEVPVRIGDLPRWQLAHTPTIDGVSCARNGLHQQPGVDYTLAGAFLASGFWAPADTIVCDYQWASY